MSNLVLGEIKGLITELRNSELNVEEQRKLVMLIDQVTRKFEKEKRADLVKDLKDAFLSALNQSNLLISNLPNEMKISNPSEIKTDFPNGINIENLPEIQKVEIMNQKKSPITQKISGDVNILNQKEVQKIKGKVNIDFPETQKVKGEVSITNFPEFPEYPKTQKIKGDVNITNLPAPIKIDPHKFTEAFRSKDVRKYIPVRLTNGKEWIEELIKVVGGGGGGGGTAAYEYENGTAGRGLINSDGHVQVTVVSSEDILNKYKVADVDDDDATTKYYGFTDITGAWYIMKEFVNGIIDEYRYTKGDDAYTTNWTARSGLTYNYFNNIFA